MNDKPNKEPTHSPEYVREISLAVYRMGLDRACKGDADSQLAKDNDGGVKQRARAAFYDSQTRDYLKVLKVPVQ